MLATPPPHTNSPPAGDAAALTLLGSDDAGNPFGGLVAREHSNYFRHLDGRVQNLSRPADEVEGSTSLFAAAVDGALRGIAADAAYPCVGSKSAVNSGAYRIGVYPTLAGAEATGGLCRDLYRFGREADVIGGRYATFVAAFDGPLGVDEETFEDLLWRQLQQLHDADVRHHAWDPAVSADPSDAEFSLSFGGRAFFLVGLHPRASRIARRFPYPAIAFNLHEQFVRLREEGNMERMKAVIRLREEDLQGNTNPVLRDHGDASEARQYSGRNVEDDWVAPFKPHASASGCPYQAMLARRSRSG